MTDGEYVSDAFIYMRGREVDYPTFDADNHMYENPDALTKFLPPEYEGIIKYVEINESHEGRVQGQDQRLHPQSHLRSGGPAGRLRGRSPAPAGHPSVDAFFDPEPRLALMKDMGIDRLDDLADAGHRRRGAAGRRSRRHPGRHPCLQPLDARALDVQLRGRHVPDADDQPFGP